MHLSGLSKNYHIWQTQTCLSSQLENVSLEKRKLFWYNHNDFIQEETPFNAINRSIFLPDPQIQHHHFLQYKRPQPEDYFLNSRARICFIYILTT